MSWGWLSKLLGHGDAVSAVSDVSDDIVDKIPYRLPLSVVNIAGTITSDFDPRTSKPRTSASSDIHVSVEADPRTSWEQHLSMASSFAKDMDFDLKLTPDGRLTSSSGTVTGAGGALLEAGIKVGTFIGSTMIGLTSKGVAFAGAAIPKDMRLDAPSFDDTLEAEEKPLYELREAYRTAIVALQNRIAANGERVAKSSEPGSGKLNDGSVLHGALELVRAEAAEVEAQVDAWRRSRFPSTSHERSVAIATDELPVLDSAQPSHRFDLAQLPAALRDTVQHLGVVVAEVRDPGQQIANPVVASDTAKAQNGIWFRATRLANLAIYERPLGSEEDFKIRVVTPTTVIDSKSDLDFVALDSSLFEKRAATMEFGDSGALSHVTRTTESAARQLSAALSTAPEAIKGAVEQAGAISSEIAKLQSDAATRRLAELNRRKETIDAEIAEKGALATRAQREALNALNAQVELAEAEHKLISLPAAVPPANRDLEDRLARAKLDIQVRQAEAELARLAPGATAPDGAGRS